MKAPLDRELYVPLYHQLKEILLREIQTGRIRPGDRLPSEEGLAATYDVSLITVRRTLGDLAAAGLLRRERGRGTFVAQPPVLQGPRELTSFSEEMRKRGLRPSSAVLEKRITEADLSIAAELKLTPGSDVFTLRRLRLADHEPMGVQTVYIPLSIAPGLVNEDLSGSSLYEILQWKFGLVPVHARETHAAITVGEEDAAVLRVPAGSPALSAKRLSFLPGGRPFELTYSVMRGDRYEIVLDLVADQRPAR